jgi:hypothetical protein
MLHNLKASKPSWASFIATLWILLITIAAIKLAATPYKHSVFPVYSAGVGDWLEGNHVYIERQGIDLYRYPPPSLPIFALFYPWHISIGVALWTITGGIGLYLAVEKLRIAILPGGSNWNDKQIAIYHSSVLLLAVRSLWNAQANTHVGALLFGGIALGSSRLWMSGVLTGMALFLKPTIISIPILAMVKQPKQIASLMAAIAGLGLILAGPWTNANIMLWKEWIDHGLASAGERRAAFRDAWSAALSIVATLSGKNPDLEIPYPPGWLGMSAIMALTALAITLMFSKCLQKGALITFAAFIGTAWFLLVGPAIEPPTYLLMGPWIGWALVNRNLGYQYLPIISIAMILVSIGVPGTPTSPLLAWAPALLPLSVVVLVPWYLNAMRKIKNTYLENLQC